MPLLESNDEPPVEIEIGLNAEEANQPLREYVTTANDSFWRISQQSYGAAGYYKALYAHNRELIEFPDRIPAGITLAIPPLESLRQLYPALCPSP